MRNNYNTHVSFCETHSDTFTTHPWRVRLAASKALVGEYVGSSAVFEAKAAGKFETRPLAPVLVTPKPEWGTYRQRAEALGIRIMVSAWPTQLQHAKMCHR